MEIGVVQTDHLGKAVKQLTAQVQRTERQNEDIGGAVEQLTAQVAAMAQPPAPPQPRPYGPMRFPSQPLPPKFGFGQRHIHPITPRDRAAPPQGGCRPRNNGPYNVSLPPYGASQVRPLPRYSAAPAAIPIGRTPDGRPRLVEQRPVNPNPNQGNRGRRTPSWTQDGRPICLRCGNIGHVQRFCRARVNVVQAEN